MTVYLDLVVLLNFGVDFFLLMGAGRLCGFPANPGKSALAALLGGIYAGICLLPEFRFLGNILWRLTVLAAMSVIAFGWNRSALRRGALFVLLSMALGGIALGINSGGFLSLITSAAGVSLLCALGFRGKAARGGYARVKLRLGDRCKVMNALRDTGNLLTDPVTGRGVLVAGADIAREMLGLTEEELRSPVETMAKMERPGLRLIPYRAVGQPLGMLLAVKMDEVRIDGEESGTLVAFAPQKIGSAEGYQALAGGS